MPASPHISDLLPELSRPNTDLVAGLVLQKHELFDELFQVFLGNEEPVSRRAAWVVDLVSEKNPHLLEPRIPEIIRMLPEFGHDGLKRHSMRMLARSPLPSGELLGTLMNICFDWLVSADEAIATKVHCMELLYRIAQVEPDLRKELADTIEWRLNEASAGFKNRGQKLLRRLNAEMDRASKT
jgi:hypothetical protein